MGDGLGTSEAVQMGSCRSRKAKGCNAVGRVLFTPSHQECPAAVTRTGSCYILLLPVADKTRVSQSEGLRIWLKKARISDLGAKSH